MFYKYYMENQNRWGQIKGDVVGAILGKLALKQDLMAPFEPRSK